MFEFFSGEDKEMNGKIIKPNFLSLKKLAQNYNRKQLTI